MNPDAAVLAQAGRARNRQGPTSQPAPGIASPSVPTKASSMKPMIPVLRGLATVTCLALMLPLAAQAQNIAIVNGKPVPKSRMDALMQQVARSGQQLPPGSEQRIKDETVLREIFAQEAERRGIQATADYRAQLELARQSILIAAVIWISPSPTPTSPSSARPWRP